MVPSSPNGPCSNGKTTSTSPRLARRLRRLEDDAGCGRSSLERHDDARRRRRRPRGRASAVSSQRCRVVGGEHPVAVPRDADRDDVVAVAVDGRASRSAAVAHDTACSDDRPPKTMATRGLRGCRLVVVIARDPYPARAAGHRAARRGAHPPTLAGVSPRRPRPRHPRRRPRARAADAPGAQVNAPLVLTSTYAADGASRLRAAPATPRGRAFEAALGALEGGDALVFSSGMAAVARGPVARARTAAVVVARAPPTTAPSPRCVDARADGRLDGPAGSTSPTPQPSCAALDGADLVWLESPTNPLLEVADLPALAAAARERGVAHGRRQHLRHPAGAAAARARRRRRRALGDQVPLRATATSSSARSSRRRPTTAARCTSGSPRHRLLHGAIAGPMEAWLALRGLRTLHVRLERATANAACSPTRLRGPPRAWSGCATPASARWSSIEVAGGAEAAERVAAATPAVDALDEPRRGRVASSSGAAGSRGAARPCPRTCCACRSASRTSTTSGTTSTAALRPSSTRPTRR